MSNSGVLLVVVGFQRQKAARDEREYGVITLSLEVDSRCS